MEPRNIRQCILQALNDAFAGKETDPESLYTFLVYMELGIIKAASPSIKKARTKGIDLINYLNSEEVQDKAKTNSNSIGDKDIKLLFDNNSDILLEIIIEIWDSNTYTPELNWMNTWETECRQFLKDKNFNELFIYLNKLIAEKIGLSDSMLFSKLMLNSFIKLSKRLLKTNKIIRIA